LGYYPTFAVRINEEGSIPIPQAGSLYHSLRR
jgi:hypothetical protein